MWKFMATPKFVKPSDSDQIKAIDGFFLHFKGIKVSENTVLLYVYFKDTVLYLCT